MRTNALPQRRLGLVGLLLAGFVTVSLFGTGCDDSDDATLDSVVTPLATETGELAMGPPTVDELQARLGLSQDQVEALTPLIADWQSQHEARRNRMGSREGRGPRFGHGSEDVNPPHMAFLGGSVEVLSREQFLEMLEFLTEKRDAARERRGELGRGRGSGPHGGFGRDCEGMPPGRHGPRDGQRHGPGGGLADELGLTDEQKEELHEAMREHREARRELMQGFHEETVTVDALRSGLKELQEDFETKIGTILDADQLAAFNEHRETRRTERLERQLERISSRDGSRRIEFLTKVLGLDDSQVAQLEEIVSSAHAEAQELLERAIAGDIDDVDAFVDRILLRQETAESIRGILNEEQAEIFDALRELHPRHGRHHRL